MARYSLKDLSPKIADSCYIAPSADLIGQVVMHNNASVWFNCVLRAEHETITIGENSNVQDGSILHVDPGYPINIHANVTVGHKVMLHGCTIGENTLIGMNAVVLNGAVIGKNCIIGANTLITENTQIPDGQMVLGSPGKIVKEVDSETIAKLPMGAKHYVDNGHLFKKHLTQES